MLWYSQYRGRSIDRIPHFINAYCGLSAAENVLVVEGKVEYWGRLLATYTWKEGTDIPIFIQTLHSNPHAFTFITLATYFQAADGCLHDTWATSGKNRNPTLHEPHTQLMGLLGIGGMLFKPRTAKN